MNYLLVIAEIIYPYRWLIVTASIVVQTVWLILQSAKLIRDIKADINEHSSGNCKECEWRRND